MFQRASLIAIVILLLLASAIALPMKRMHYDEPSIDSDGFYEPSESPRPQPETVISDPIALARQLLTPAEGDGNPFRKEYARLLQESPEVVLAHASALRALT